MNEGRLTPFPDPGNNLFTNFIYSRILLNENYYLKEHSDILTIIQKGVNSTCSIQELDDVLNFIAKITIEQKQEIIKKSNEQYKLLIIEKFCHNNNNVSIIL
jgi:hypothetical protein